MTTRNSTAYWVKRFEDHLADLEKGPPRGVDAIVHQAEVDAVKGQLDDLRADLARSEIEDAPATAHAMVLVRKMLVPLEGVDPSTQLLAATALLVGVAGTYAEASTQDPRAQAFLAQELHSLSERLQELVWPAIQPPPPPEAP